jgi:DNA-binding NarL/FixJ family response regulator
MEYILALSAESSINEIDIMKKISDHIKSVGSQLTLHPLTNILDEDKKKILKNLYESGMEEDAIADQLDLDIRTVRDWIKQLL